MVSIPYCPEYLVDEFEPALLKVYELLDTMSREDKRSIISYSEKAAKCWMDDWDLRRSDESKKYGRFLDAILKLDSPTELLKIHRNKAAMTIQRHLRGWYVRKTQLWNPNCPIGKWDIGRKTRKVHQED